MPAMPADGIVRHERHFPLLRHDSEARFQAACSERADPSAFAAGFQSNVRRHVCPVVPGGSLKITGPNLFDLNFSASALESNSLAG
jgi:hypothetical protein